MGRSIHGVRDCTITVEGGFLRYICGFSDSMFPGLYGPGKRYTFHYAGVYNRPDAITGLLKYADFRGAKGKIPLRNDSGHYYSLADYRTGYNHSGVVSTISHNYAGYYIARKNPYLSCDEYTTFLCPSIDDTNCLYYSVDFLQKADFYSVIDYAGVRAGIHNSNHLARAVKRSDKHNVYCKSCNLELGSLFACFASRLYEAVPGWPGANILIVTIDDCALCGCFVCLTMSRGVIPRFRNIHHRDGELIFQVGSRDILLLVCRIPCQLLPVKRDTH